mmetsp:Transcript_5736/g.8471  ORF Transcript_5736/g.8471 Transcript_5736/m.8471 type:complete len:229 (-) Transcript_5736:762-1448(-)
MQWISDEELCLGFEGQYTIVQISRGKVTELSQIHFGAPILRQVQNHGILCAIGKETVCYSNPETQTFSLSYTHSDGIVSLAASRLHCVSVSRGKLTVHGLPQRHFSQNSPSRNKLISPDFKDNRKSQRHQSTSSSMGSSDVLPSLHRYESRTENWQWQWLREEAHNNYRRKIWTPFNAETNKVIEMAYRKEHKECSIRSDDGKNTQLRVDLGFLTFLFVFVRINFDFN